VIVFDGLNVPASVTTFAQLVGVSQQSISQRIAAGELAQGQTLLQWLHAYCDRLRTVAAGRSGDDSAALTRARTEEALASAQLKQLQVAEKAGVLIPVDEVEPRLASMVTAVRQELLALPEKLAGEIRALHEIDIDAALIEQHIHDALNHLAGDLSGDDCGDVSPGSSAVVAAAEDHDD
jgi:phage terminase Nu1 subunit (DNA packaging protein)